MQGFKFIKKQLSAIGFGLAHRLFCLRKNEKL
jgi:hypothetical protein